MRKVVRVFVPVVRALDEAENAVPILDVHVRKLEEFLDVALGEIAQVRAVVDAACAIRPVAGREQVADRGEVPDVWQRRDDIAAGFQHGGVAGDGIPRVSQVLQDVREHHTVEQLAACDLLRADGFCVADDDVVEHAGGVFSHLGIVFDTCDVRALPLLELQAERTDAAPDIQHAAHGIRDERDQV